MKNIKFTIFFFLCALNAYSQVPPGLFFVAGAEKGIWDSEDLLADGGTGFVVGMGANWGYSERCNFETNILLKNSVLDFYYTDQAAVAVGKAKANAYSVGVSAQFNYYFIKPEEDKFYAGALAGFGLFFTDGQYTVKNSNYEELYLPYRVDPTNLTRFEQFSFTPLAGIVTGYNDFRLSLKYNLGTTNLIKAFQTSQYDQNNNYTGPSLEGKLSSISLMLSYQFTHY